VAEFSAFVNRTGCLRRHVTGDATRKRKLGKEALHALLIGRNVRINLSVGTLEIGVRNQSGPTMPRAGDVDHVDVSLLHDAVQGNRDEVPARCGSPVTEEPRLDMFLREGLLEQRVIVEIDLADG